MRILTGMLEQVGECFEQMLASALVYGIPVFVLALSAVFILRKRNFKRFKSRWFLPLYQLLISLSVALAIGGYAAIHKAEDFSRKQVSRTLIPLIRATFPSYQLYLKFNKIELYSERSTVKETIDNHLSFLEYHPLKKGLYEKWKVKAANNMVPMMAKRGLLEVMLLRIPEISEDQKVSVYFQDILRLDVDQFHEPDWKEINNKLNGTIEVFFLPYLNGLFAVCGIFFLFPVFHLLIIFVKFNAAS